MSTGGYADGPTELVGSNASIDMLADSAEGGRKLLENSARTLEKVAALLYENPDYCENTAKWKKYLDCYEADDIYEYIHEYLRESEESFKLRVARGYYYNYCAAVVDLFVAYLFQAPIIRDPKSLRDEFSELYDNADRAGTKYVYMMETVAAFAQIFGHVGILVDAPQIEGDVRSEADRKEKGIRPYLTIIRANQIKDWEIDNEGNFVWVKIEVCRPEPTRTWNMSVDETARHFIIWTRKSWEEWRVAGEEAELVNSGDHELGVVPLVIVRNEKMTSHPWMGSSAIRDIADINIAILNWSSLADEEIAERCLNILTMERDQSDAPALLSHSNVLEYAPGASPPQYLTPGSTPLELIGKQIDRAKDEIYRLAKLGGSTGLLGVREATSGIAYAYEFNETNQTLARKAESLEQAEIEIHRLFAKWLKKDFDGTILYPKEFGVDDFLTEFQILSEARANLTSDSAIKEIEKKLASKLFARESLDFRKKVANEVDAADPKAFGLGESFGTVPPAMVNGSPSAKPNKAAGSSNPDTGKTGK